VALRIKNFLIFFSVSAKPDVARISASKKLKKFLKNA